MISALLFALQWIMKINTLPKLNMITTKYNNESTVQKKLTGHEMCRKRPWIGKQYKYDMIGIYRVISIECLI